MKNAMEEACNLMLYAHVCAKSIHDMNAARYTEQMIDYIVRLFGGDEV